MDMRLPARVWVSMLFLICCWIVGPSASHAAGGGTQTQDDLSGLPRVLADKVVEQRRELVRFKTALLAYVALHNELPRKIADAVGPETGMDLPPRDYFRNQMTVTYVVQASMKEAIFYSYGPDGKDDKGAALKTSVAPGAIPTGDIVEGIDLAAMEREREEAKQSSGRLNRRLVEKRKTTGHENAIIYYIDACGKMDTPPEASLWAAYEDDVVGKTVANGWGAALNPAVGILARNKPAMVIARKGMDLDNAANDLCRDDPAQYLDLAKLHSLAWMFVLEGRRFESVGRPVDAIESYLALMTMGRDLGTSETTLRAADLGASLQQLALDRIMWLVGRNQFETIVMQVLANRFKEVEATQPRFGDVLASERAITEALVARWRRGGVAAGEPDDTTGVQARLEALLNTRVSGETVDAFDACRKKFDAWNKTRFDLPVWQREAQGYGPEAFKKFADALPPQEKAFAVDDADAELRMLAFRAGLRAARCAIALDLYRRKYGAYPNALTALVPAMLDAVPADPFTGNPLIYRSNGGAYRLWSVGPDMRSNAAMVTYDPTNGIASAGDILQAR